MIPKETLDKLLDLVNVDAGVPLTEADTRFTQLAHRFERRNDLPTGALRKTTVDQVSYIYGRAPDGRAYGCLVDGRQ